MSAQHPPGPWRVENRIFVKAENGWKVATVNVPNERVGAWEIDPQDTARLIAAAPEIFEALVALLGQVEQARDGFGIWPYANSESMARTLEVSRAAISKARGQ